MGRYNEPKGVLSSMESGNTEITSPTPVVDHVVQKTGQGLLDRLVHIPISEQTVKNILVVSEQLNAPALQKVRSTLEKHADTLGKVVAVGSTFMDITLATVCAAIGVEKFPPKSELQSRRAAMFKRLDERTAKLPRDKAAKTATALLAGSSAILIIRPISRIVSWEAHAGAPLAERIGQIMNKMAGGKEAIPNPS